MSATEQSTFKYLEIRYHSSNIAVKRMDVTDKSERQIDKVDFGLNINLNHEEFYTIIIESKTKLNTI